MMHQLADRARGYMSQYEPRDLADATYALGHAGALDEQYAQALLAHAARAAAQGQLDVQGLAEVLGALGAAR